MQLLKALKNLRGHVKRESTDVFLCVGIQDWIRHEDGSIVAGEKLVESRLREKGIERSGRFNIPFDESFTEEELAAATVMRRAARIMFLNEWIKELEKLTK